MKTFEDFEADAKEFSNTIKLELEQKYKSFMTYLSKMIQTILKDNEKEIISWFKQIKNGDETLILFADEHIHHIRIGIGLSNNAKSRIIITLIESYDKYYNPIIGFNSDECINEFFERDYTNFLKFYAPCDRNAENLVINFVNQFNNAFYKQFKSKFELIYLDINSFKKSKYALSFSSEKLSEISNQILEYYDEFVKIAQDSSHVVEAAKKGIM